MEGGKKTPRKEMGYRVFPDVNRIARPKAVTSIPILLGHFRQLHRYSTSKWPNWPHNPLNLKRKCHNFGSL